jgi:hypothetical protein
MDIISSIPRYDKNQLIIIDNYEIPLIEYLRELRTHKKITKKKISNLIKHNDYWYSQIERNGKKGDDNRQKTIYRNDLVDIISIVFYNCFTSNEIKENITKSENYLDKVLKAVPIQSSIKALDARTLFRNRTSVEQDKLFTSLIESLMKLLTKVYDSMYLSADKDRFLEALKNTNAILKIDSHFMLYLMELPFTDFLYDAKQEQVFSLLKDLSHITDSFSNNENKSLEEYYSCIINKIKEYTGENSNLKEHFSLLPIDFFQ